MKKCKPGELNALEEFLKGLRIETEYLKDVTTGEPRRRILKIKGFGRMRYPAFNDDGTHKKDEQNKVQREDEAETTPGNARDLKFPRNGKMISVIDYYASRRVYHRTYKVSADT